MKKLDVQMLSCLEALVTEAHLSRAASRVGISQPAMSDTLARLRRIFDDPLLVRTRQGMTPTPRAIQAIVKTREALKLLGEAIAGSGDFEPAGSAMNVRIVALTSLTFSLLPKLMQHLHGRAPGIRLVMEPADVRRTREMLESGECDMVIGYPPIVSTGLHAQSLFRLNLACIARIDHPSISGKLTLDQYMETPHVVLGAGTNPVSTIEATVERSLRRRRRERTVALRSPDNLVSAAVVAETDFIATISSRLAYGLAGMLKLQVMKLPLPVAVPSILMIWHERTHRDPGHRFLRQIVREVGSEIDAMEKARVQPIG